MRSSIFFCKKKKSRFAYFNELYHILYDVYEPGVLYKRQVLTNRFKKTTI